MDKDYLLKKWLANELSSEELKEFEASEDYAFHQEIIDSAQHFRASHFSKPGSFEDIEPLLSKPLVKRKTSNMQILMRIAAVFVLGLGLYFAFFNNDLSNYKTLASEKETFELPDTSIVTLNALSEISFNSKNWEDNRKLNLKGEAFFKVAKGKVFDVITNDGIVTVVGTQFSVKQRQDYFEVQCFEGIVSVNSANQTTKLLAGDVFRFYDGMVAKTATPNQIPQWTNNISEFKSVPYKEVLNEFERQYNINIQYTGAKLNQLFNGGFIHGDIENALKSISIPLELTYSIESATQVRIFDRED